MAQCVVPFRPLLPNNDLYTGSPYSLDFPDLVVAKLFSSSHGAREMNLHVVYQ